MLKLMEERSTGLRNTVEIDSFDFDLVLGIRFLDFASFSHDDFFDLSLSNEVTDLQCFSLIQNSESDWEVGVYSFHLIFVAFSDAVDHVLDGGGDCLNGSLVLIRTEPHFDDHFSFLDLDIN